MSGFEPNMREIEGGGVKFLPVPSLRNEIIISVSIGHQHVLCVNRKGEVFSWGKGANGRLGHGVNLDLPSPERISTLDRKRIFMVAAGRDHSLCISQDGDAYAFGMGSKYQLGLGTNNDEYTPTKIPGIPSIKYASAGFLSTMLLSRGGRVYVMGSSNFGNLGLGFEGENHPVTTPRHVEILNRMTTGICHISAGDYHSCAVSNDGWLFTWGNGASGRLGHGNDLDLYEPLRVDSLLGVKVIAASAGGGHTVALDSQGRVYTMGEGSAGQLGNGSYVNESRPKIIRALEDTRIINVSAGSGHTCCVTAAGNILSWGCGWNGRLGYKTLQNIPYPKYIVLGDSLGEEVPV